MFAKRRSVVFGAAALAVSLLTACNGGGGGAISGDDMTLGVENAPITLIEYASATCPHCATFHEEAFEQLKTNYIDTGRVRYVFREYPTAPAPVAVAAFQLARCGGASEEQYFARLGEIFRQQQAMFASGSMEGVRNKLIEIGNAAGLTTEQVTQCISDEAGAERIRRIVDQGNREFSISGTPTFIINGEKVEGIGNYETLSRALEAAGAN